MTIENSEPEEMIKKLGLGKYVNLLYGTLAIGEGVTRTLIFPDDPEAAIDAYVTGLVNLLTIVPKYVVKNDPDGTKGNILNTLANIVATYGLYAEAWFNSRPPKSIFRKVQPYASLASTGLYMSEFWPKSEKKEEKKEQSLPSC